MTRKDKRKEVAFALIDKQLELAGVGKTLQELIDAGENEYYSNYTINFEQHQKWLDWAVPYVMKKLRHHKSWAMQEVQMLDLSHGLKFDEKDSDKFFSKN